MSFLADVCRDILNKHSLESLQNLTLVLPNKRSEATLKQCFAKVEQPFILPKFCSFQEFILDISTLQPFSALEGLLLLYKVWQQKTKGEFEHFLRWAPTFMKDMEDIQKTLLDPSKILDELGVISGIQQFSKGRSAQTEAFWNTLKQSYNHFIELALRARQAPFGLIYKDAVDKIETYLSQTRGTIVLIGFNALSKAEEQMFNKILDSGKGDIYWDMDANLLDQPFHKYGSFFNRYQKEWTYFKTHEAKWLGDDYAKVKNISIRSGSGPMGQALALNNLFKLQTLQPNTPMAIVLNEQRVLLPTLNVLEQVRCEANITMGYPLSYKNVGAEYETDLIKEAKSLLEQFGIKPQQAIVEYCCAEKVRQYSVPFDTDSSAPVQVMEMLETRLLDFDTVVMLSINEGTILPSNRYNSLIAFKDRIRLGLPTYLDQEAIYTYHFYRLLHRTKNVHLIYDSAEGAEAKEKSRLIHQIEQDKEVKHKIYYESKKKPYLKIKPLEPLTIQKPQICLDKLKALVVDKGLSQTALTTYFYDPIAFYERYVLKVSKEEPEDPIAPNALGTAIHELLHQEYQPLIGTVLNPEKLVTIKNVLPKTVSAYFESQGKALEGKTYLASKVVERYLTQFLNFEINTLRQEQEPVTLLALEKTYETSLPIPSLGIIAKLYGNIDRVDRVGTQTRIIDYKTGKVLSTNILKVLDMSLLVQEHYFKHFQLLFYALIFLSNHVEIDSVQSGLFFLKDLKMGLHYLENGVDKSSGINKDYLAHFEGFLQNAIGEILNSEIPFVSKIV